MAEFLFTGLAGGNPLAFLAALGTLRISSLAFPKNRVALRWRNAGEWKPELIIDSDIECEEWLTRVQENLRSHQPAFCIASDLNIPCEHFRRIAAEAKEQASSEFRSYADFVAAFGSEVIETSVNGKRTGVIADTAFRTMSGAGHQHFVGYMAKLQKQTDEAHLRTALFDPWAYVDPGPSMRWDPKDDRRYAQRWDNPSEDPIRTVRGANRFAIEAIPFFSTAPVGDRLETVGFTQRRKAGTEWSWPVWSGYLSVDSVRSLVSLSELQRLSPDRASLHKMGIEEVYRCQRVSRGKYRNFSAANPV